MAGAIRMVSLSRGHDPRDFALFAFGGAGPLHAVGIARELGLAEVIVPARPGLTNALGCLVADLRQDFVKTLNRPLDALDVGAVADILAEHERAGRALNAAGADEIEATEVRHGADMQFRGQTHLIRVALPSARMTREALHDLFERAYFARFHVRLPEIKAQLVNLTTTVIGRRRAFPIGALIDAAPARKPGDALTGARRLYADGRWHEARVFARERLSVGATIEGPAVIEQIDATTVIEPGARADVDGLGNLRIRVGTESATADAAGEAS
jgi:N-methylhydantoinase A